MSNGGVGGRGLVRRGVLLTVAMMLLAACGSTAQESNTLTRDGLGSEIAEDQFSLGDSGDATGEGPSGLAVGREGDGATSAGPGATAGTGAGGGTNSIQTPDGTTGPSQPPPKDGERGQGYTADKIYIGFQVTDSQKTNEVYDKAGLEYTAADSERAANVLVNDVNNRGGIANREVVPVFARRPPGATDPEAGAAACETFTVDRPVFAVAHARMTGGTESYMACLAKRNVIVSSPMAGIPRLWYERYSPFFYGPAEPSMEVHVAAKIPRLVAMGYFEGGWDADPAKPGIEPTKIGAIFYEEDPGHAYVARLRRELARYGLTLTETYATARGPSGDKASNAVVRFRRAGVTHVFFQLDWIIYLWAPQASSQNYWPRYNLSTQGSPASAPTNLSSDQLNGAVGIGWAPVRDVPPAKNPGPVSAAETRCVNLMKKGGLQTDKQSVRGQLTGECDRFWFLERAIKIGGLSAEGIQRATQKMKMPPASTFRISFTDGRATGPAGMRDITYRVNGDETNCGNDDNGCFVYTSKIHGM